MTDATQTDPQQELQHEAPQDTPVETATRSIVLEHLMPYPAQKVWRALTEVPLLDAWLLQSDFQPIAGHRFQFQAPVKPGWNGIIDCEVLIVEPHKRLAYTWNVLGEQSANGLKTRVTWTLTSVEAGTIVRMEQSGFRADQARALGGANYGWNHFFDGLEQALAQLDETMPADCNDPKESP
jgi:uncharacterized protein YndB with AHSA1/START domain